MRVHQSGIEGSKYFCMISVGGRRFLTLGDIDNMACGCDEAVIPIDQFIDELSKRRDDGAMTVTIIYGGDRRA